MDAQNSWRLELGGSHHFPFIIFYVIHHKSYIQMTFFSGLQARNPTILEIEIPAILDTHNFLCKPLIEVKSKKKL